MNARTHLLLPLGGLFAVACGGSPADPAAQPSARAAAPAPASAARVSPSSSWTARSSDSGSDFGTTVALVDLNGDGLDDVVVGAPAYDSLSSQTDEGAWYLYAGATSGGPVYQAITETNESYRRLGTSVAAAGDVDGDGIADLVVGARGHSSQNELGSLFVYYGAGSFALSQDSFSYGSDDDAYFGDAVAGPGDVDGDGYADLLVGAPGQDTGGTNRGAAHLFLGQSGGVNTSVAWSVYGDASNDDLGEAVSGAGDVDGDGVADLLVGAPDGGGGNGHVKLFLGASGSTPASTADATFDGAADGDRFGESLSAVGDINGDGYDDFAVGAPYHDGAATLAGAIYVYAGAPSVADVAELQRIDGPSELALFGSSIAGGGDFDDDGFDDLLGGAILFSPGFGPTSVGAAFAYAGAATGFLPTPPWSVVGSSSFDLVGSAVAIGDPNGDGYADALIGAENYSVSGTRYGQVLLYDGGPSDSDGDGYDDVAYGGTDCDDSDPEIYPGQPELCDGLDNDCDGSLPTDEQDEDGDGYVACTFDIGGWDGGDEVWGDEDCDDDEWSIHPDASEWCDGLDTDCDGSIPSDEQDDDGDGYVECDTDTDGGAWGFPDDVDGGEDCDDGDASVHPGASEVCDGVDNNCDGDVDDEEAEDATRWYVDDDGDTFGSDEVTLVACDQPDGFVGRSGDCDDSEPRINPDAEERCNDRDDDCNGDIDDDPVDAPTWYDDDDGDGYGRGGARNFCDPPGVGWAREAGDCNDRNPEINPGADESDPYDGRDEDCDGAVEDQWITGGSPWGCSATPGPARALWWPLVGLGLLLARRRTA